MSSEQAQHEFELVAPGFHGAKSVTGRCVCPDWSHSVFVGQPDTRTPEEAEARLRAAFELHVRAAREDAAAHRAALDAAAAQERAQRRAVKPAPAGQRTLLGAERRA